MVLIPLKPGISFTLSEISELTPKVPSIRFWLANSCSNNICGVFLLIRNGRHLSTFPLQFFANIFLPHMIKLYVLHLGNLWYLTSFLQPGYSSYLLHPIIFIFLNAIFKLFQIFNITLTISQTQYIPISIFPIMP